MRASARVRGFTLVELMFAVAVVAILLALAYPSFMQQLMKSRRADAKSALLRCAQVLERYHTQYGHYTAGADAGVVAACTGPTGSGFYSLPAANIPGSAGATSFLIKAVPAGSQASDSCATFTYADNGTKDVSGGTLASAKCW